jgi:hypothetical protein
VTPAVRFGRWLGRHVPRPVGLAMILVARRLWPDVFARALDQAEREAAR